ncbi:MAG TPA: ABC transporter ATP-binding protein [Planctomycetota bacterium]|nr:ABC transporter ATP-binding protein [Planctomycetota bacterium]
MTAIPVPWRTAFGMCALAGRSGLLAQSGLVIVQALLPVLGLFAMQWLVDAVAKGLAGAEQPDVAFVHATTAVAIAAAVALCGSLARSVAAVVAETHGRQLADACALRMQEHAADLDLGEYDRAAFHDLLHRAGTEANQRPVRLVQDLMALATALVSLVAMAFLLARIELWLPLVVGAAAVPIAWARARHARLRFEWHEQHPQPQREVGYLGAVLTGRATAKDLRALGLQRLFAERLATLRTGLRASLRALALGRSRDELLVHTIASLGLFGAYLYLGHTALLGGLSIGGLVLHAQAAQRAQSSVRDVLGSLAAVGEDRMFLRPFVEFLALQPRLVAALPVAEPPPGPVAITARAVGFRYPDSTRDALRDVSFTFAPGERIAIVGQNGSGKSTLVKLLCRLYDPTTGLLSVGGIELPHLQPERWRQRLAVLLQDANSFELTLRENLRLGRRDNSDHDKGDAALWQALEVVGLADRVRQLPHGLATPLSRRLPDGIELSGGEQRRLVLARALAQPADVLLLDEPFALLDGAAATALATELKARPRAQTIVVVDHRVAAVRWVDRVLLLDAGALVANAPPTALAATEARFRALFPDW